MVPLAVRLALALLLATAGALLVIAAPDTTPDLVPRSVDEPPVARPGLMEVPRETLSPRLLEIRDLLEAESRDLAILAARYRNTTDDAEAMRIQREIHELKSGTEVAMLKIQLKYARLEENHEAVARLEAVLERVEAGPAIEAPPVRPRTDSHR